MYLKYRSDKTANEQGNYRAFFLWSVDIITVHPKFLLLKSKIFFKVVDKKIQKIKKTFT